MMKLVIAIIQDDDVAKVMETFGEHSIQATKLSTKGAFLRLGNTTIMTGVAEETVPLVLELLEQNCKSRNQFASLPMPCGSIHGFMPKPIEVTVGGATVFVLDVEQFIKF